MKQVRVMPFLAIVLLAAACGEESGPSETAASVRFFNATTDMAGSGGFTANGQFASGSALALGQASSACSEVEAGATSFGFGASNESGTGLSGGELATLSDQSLTAADNVTVVATGSAASPELFLLSNNFSDALASNQAAVRFVNLAPGTGETANLFNVLTGTIGSGPTDVFEIGLEVGDASAFKTVASGSSPYSILIGHSVAVSGSGATLDLQPGSVNTVAIVPDPASGGYQLVNIPRCPA